MFKPILFSLIAAPLLWAVPMITHQPAMPTIETVPALNLQNYLNFQTDYELHMTCKAQKIHFVCQVPKYRHENIDELTKEVTEITGMRKADIRFEKKQLFPRLSQEKMTALYRDIAQTEAKKAKKTVQWKQSSFDEPETSPLQEELDENIAEAFRSLHINDFYLQEQNASNSVTVKEIELLNDLQRSSGKHHYDYPVFGDISLKLKAVQTNKKQYHTFTERLIASIEGTFSKPDPEREAYISKRLNEISAKEFNLPSDLTVTLQNRPAKNDAITVKFMANMQNSAGTLTQFVLNALVTGASEYLLKKAQKKPVSSDLIVQHILLLSTWGSADTYVKALKNDLRFRNYIKQYASKLDELLSKEMKQSSDKVLTGIIKKLNTSFHHLLDGTSDTLKIELNSKNNSSVTSISQAYMQAIMMASMRNPKDNNSSTGVTTILNNEYLIYIEDSKSKK